MERWPLFATIGIWSIFNVYSSFGCRKLGDQPFSVRPVLMVEKSRADSKSGLQSNPWHFKKGAAVDWFSLEEMMHKEIQSKWISTHTWNPQYIPISRRPDGPQESKLIPNTPWRSELNGVITWVVAIQREPKWLPSFILTPGNVCWCTSNDARCPQDNFAYS